jgi:hypothetical protein
MEESDEEPLTLPEEDEEEKLRQRREAILAKFKNRGATTSTTASPAHFPPAPAVETAAAADTDIFAPGT